MNRTSYETKVPGEYGITITQDAGPGDLTNLTVVIPAYEDVYISQATGSAQAVRDIEQITAELAEAARLARDLPPLIIERHAPEFGPKDAPSMLSAVEPDNPDAYGYRCLKSWPDGSPCSSFSADGQAIGVYRATECVRAHPPA
jgi:hypothetical protein